MTRDDIEHALQNCTLSWETNSDSIQYIGPGMDGRDLKVWLLPPGYVDGDSRMIVKSVAWEGEEDPR